MLAQVAFSRKPSQVMTMPWIYEPGHLICKEDKSVGRMHVQEDRHDLVVELDEDKHEGASTSQYGNFTYTFTMEGQDKYAKRTKNIDGTVSDGHFMEQKVYTGVFSLSSGQAGFRQCFDVACIGEEITSGEKMAILFKCTHHPITNKQWPGREDGDGP